MKLSAILLAIVLISGPGQLLFCQENPKAIKAFDKGNAFFDQENYTDAIDEFSKAVDLDNGFAKAYFRRGITYNKLGKGDLAFADFTTSVRLDSANIEYNATHAYMCVSYFEKFDDAIVDYNRIIRIAPDTKRVYYSRGLAYFIKKQYDLAINDFTKQIEQEPGQQTYYFYRARCYSETGQYDKSILDFSKTLEIDPKLQIAYKIRGQVYYMLKDYPSALSDWSKAIAMKDNDLFSILASGIVYYQTGDSENSKMFLSMAISREKSLKKGIAAVQKLEDNNKDFNEEQLKILEQMYKDPAISNFPAEFSLSDLTYEVSNTFEMRDIETSSYKTLTPSMGEKLIKIRVQVSNAADEISFQKEDIILENNNGNLAKNLKLKALDNETGTLMYLKLAGDESPTYTATPNPTYMLLIFEIPQAADCGVRLKFVDAAIDVLKPCAP